MGGSAFYSKRRRAGASLAGLALATGAAWLTGCTAPRPGIDPEPFLARSSEARTLERAAISCMTDDRCTSRQRIAAWESLIEKHPTDGLRALADLGLLLSLIEADSLIRADEVVGDLEQRAVLPPLVADGFVLARAALDNRRERASSALERLAPLEGRFIDAWLTVRWTRERVLAYRRSGRSEDALRAMSIWIAGLRDDSPEIAEARRIAESFDDVALETYLRVRAGRANPEAIPPGWLGYLVDRVSAAILKERRARSAQWLLENPSLTARLRTSAIDALRLLASELGRRGTDKRARAVIAVSLGDDTAVRRALAFADGVARQTANLASELVIETLFLEPSETLDRRLGHGAGIDVLVGGFAASEVAALAAFTEPRPMPLLLGVAKPRELEARARVFSVGLDASSAAAALLAEQPGPLAFACIGADCTGIEPLLTGREEGIRQAKRVFLRGPVDLAAVLPASNARPLLLGLPDDFEAPHGRCFDRVSVRPVGHPDSKPTGNWWFDLGADVGALLATAVRMEGATTTPFGTRLQSAIIRARTSASGNFQADGALHRDWTVVHEPCAKGKSNSAVE